MRLELIKNATYNRELNVYESVFISKNKDNLMNAERVPYRAIR